MDEGLCIIPKLTTADAGACKRNMQAACDSLFVCVCARVYVCVYTCVRVYMCVCTYGQVPSLSHCNYSL